MDILAKVVFIVPELDILDVFAIDTFATDVINVP